MAENESLDLSSPRMREVFEAVRNGVSYPEVASKLESALIGGLRKALKQFKESGVTLADLLRSRECPPARRQLLRILEGHEYAWLVPDSETATGPTEKDCVEGWIDAILDKVTDQICVRVVGSEHYPTIDELRAFTTDVRGDLQPVVERLASKLAKNPDWLPKRTRKKGRGPDGGIAGLLNRSLL